MDDPLLVRGFEGLRNLLRDWQGVVDGDRAAGDALRQIVALDQFHHEGRDVGGFLQPIDLRNVRMVQRGEHFSFALKTRKAIRIAGDRGRQNLDRHRSFQVAVGRTIHLAHSARAEGGEDFVGAETGTGQE